MKITRRRFIEVSTVTGLGVTGMSLTACANSIPAVRADPMMPAPGFIETHGITMAVYEQGQGPAIVFCHGFPELAFSWRSQVAALSSAGYHAIAPDQRGYGLTGGPDDPAQYDMQFICDDLAGLLDAKGIERVV